MNWQEDKRFCDFIGWVIQREGSQYEDAPGDNGGPTKFGIDKASHKQFSTDYIRNLTEDQAKAIYYQESWLGTFADQMPFPIGELVADIHINGGHGMAWLQTCLNQIVRPHTGLPMLVVDGSNGPATQAMLKQSDSLSLDEQVAACMLNKRNAYFEALAGSFAHDRQFLRGWLNRDKELASYIASESTRMQSIAHPADYLA